MHLTSRLPHPLQDHQSAGAHLGPNHPLVRVLNRRRTRLEQSLVVAALLTASVIALADGVSEAPPILVAAGVVQVALACATAMLSCPTRDHALDLLIQGQGNLPLAAVKRERARLQRHHYRQRLAQSLDDMRNEAEHPTPPACRMQTLYSAHAIGAVAPELAAITALLRSEHAALGGTAAAARLLIDGTSPLYRQDVDRLREELHRIRYLLEACTGPERVK